MTWHWADDATLLAKARALWDEGLGATQIGIRMGLTAGQITGVAKRRDWPKHMLAHLKHPPGTWKRSTAPKVDVADHMSGETHAVRFDDKRRSAMTGNTLPAMTETKPRLSFKQIASLGRRPVKPVTVQPVPEINAAPASRLTCQFPLWGNQERVPRDPAKRFCDAPVFSRPLGDGSVRQYPYCLKHARTCYGRTPQTGEAA